MTDEDRRAAPREAGGTHAILAASFGNILEWYDFAVYAAFAIAIGANFFPGESPGIDVVKAFLLFGAGFIIRPAGAITVGIYGDRAGRKAALTATILLMAGGTLIIAVTPTYAVLGLAAPWILLAGRLLQGFSAGGEIGSAAAFLVEHAPPARRALFAAWLQGSMGISNILGALVAYSVNTLLAPSEVTSWGWRLPFLLGLCIVPLGFYLRRTLAETPEFKAQASHPARAPLRLVFGEYRRELLSGFGISILWAAAVYVLLIFMPIYLQKAQGFSPRVGFGAAIVENVVFVAGCFGFGAWADRIGHARVQAYGAWALLLGVLPIFWCIDRFRSIAVLLPAVAALGLAAASFTSVAPTVLSELFPTRVRVTGVSLVYNAAFTIFGGFAPAILFLLATRAGASSLAPAWYVTLAALPALAATLAPFRRPSRPEDPIRES
jgi:MFS transporter, MHS family, proline/betaine transporter